MKRPRIFNLMSHRQVINCPTEGLARRPEGESQMKEITEIYPCGRLECASHFRYFFYLTFPSAVDRWFCGTQEKIHISVQLKLDYYANSIRSLEILLKIRTG